MKRNLLISVVAIAALTAAGSALAGVIKNSDHDLGTDTENTTDNGQICVYCHTPHNANQAIGPLWNRNATGSTFIMYNSPTMDSTRQAQPQGVSIACLGCHDGTISLDQIINAPSGWTEDNARKVGGDTNLGTDLSNDHPISLTYGTATPTGDWVPIITVKTTVPLFGAGGDQVECGSCHSVHDPAIFPFLRVDNADSALCFSCHIK